MLPERDREVVLGPYRGVEMSNGSLPPEEVYFHQLDLCEDVARASRGLLGLGDKISEDERNAIRTIAESLNPEAREESEQRIRKRLGADSS